MKLFLVVAFIVVPMSVFASYSGQCSSGYISQDQKSSSCQSDHEKRGMCSIDMKSTDARDRLLMEMQAARNLRTLCKYAKKNNRELVGDRKEFKKKELERFRRACVLLCVDAKAYFMSGGEILSLGEKIN